MKMNAYITVDKDNQPIGVDSDSGGYHYVAASLNDIRYWHTEVEAQKYVDIFKSSCHVNKPVAVKSVRLIIG